MAIINTVRGTVTMVGGTATITYPIKKPKPTKNNLVKAVVSAPMNLSSNVTIDKYVEPRLNPTYSIERGDAFSVFIGDYTGVHPGATLIFKVSNPDYLNKPVRLHFYWGASTATKYMDGGNLYYNANTNSKGNAMFTITIPTIAQMKPLDPSITVLSCEFNFEGTVPLNPPYAGELINRARVTTKGGLRLTNTPIAHRGALSPSSWKTFTGRNTMDQDYRDNIGGTGYPPGWLDY